MRLKWSFLMILAQGIKSFYPVELFRDFPPFSRSITENVTIYRRDIENLTHAVFLLLLSIYGRNVWIKDLRFND